MKKFLAGVAEHIMMKHGNNLSNVLVLLPNQRTCTYFTAELKEQAVQTVFAPEICTLQNWMLAQSNLQPIDRIELLVELHSCHQQIGGVLSLDDFIGTANVLLNDFEEIDLQMANAKSFFKNLELLQSMKTYQPGERPTEYHLQYRQFWEDFSKLYHLLRQQLSEKQIGYRGMILRQVVENAKLLDLTADAIYLVGFGLLNKCDEAMFLHLINQYQAEVIWDADKYYVNNTINEAGKYFREHLTLFKQKEKSLTDGISTGEKHIKIIGAAKNVGQVKVAANILQNELEITAASALETVIVLPDEKLLSPLIANLPINIPAVNITMGIGINGTSAAAFFEILFRMYLHAQKYTSAHKQLRFYHKDIFDLLQHNYCRLLFGNLGADAFIYKMKKQNRVIISGAEINSAFDGKLNALLLAELNTQAFAAMLQQVAAHLLRVLMDNARKGNTLLAADAEITYRLLQIFSSTQTVFSAANPLSIKTYVGLLTETLRNTRVALEGEPVQGLQIMGLHETRSLNFKNVIILSANEGILQKGKTTNSYIPYDLQREFLLTYKERDALNAYLFYRLFHQAENIFILYNTEPDELGGGEKSRLILQLQHELQNANPRAKIQDMLYAVDPPPVLPETDIVITKNAEIQEKLIKLLTQSGLSPSALNTYINCSLQYYFRYIAGLREQDEMEENMDAATIGSAVHHALEKIYEPQIGKQLTAAYLAAEASNKKRIGELISEKLEERFDRDSLRSGKNLLLYTVCIKLTEQFLKHEAETLAISNQAGSNLTLQMIEGVLESVLEVNKLAIKIKGRVDRIDVLDGVVQIADYKTSKHAAIPMLADEVWQELHTNPKYAKPVQLLMYAWLYQRMQAKPVPIRSGIYWLRQQDKQLDTLYVSKTSDVLTAETILLFEEKLKAIVSDMLNPEIAFEKTTDEERCKYCDFKNICQRN